MLRDPNEGPITVGGCEGGVMAAMFLLGVSTVQTCTYYRKYPNDPPRMKTFVATIWLLEVAHAAFIAQALYLMTIPEYGVLAPLEQPMQKIGVSGVLFASIEMSIQSFFSYRIHILTESWMIPCICWFLAFVQFVGHTSLAAWVFVSGSNHDWKDLWRPYFCAVMSVSTCADLIIAASLCRSLWKSHTEKVRGNFYRKIDQVIIWSLQTGVMTSVAVVTILVLFLTLDSDAWISVFFCLSRLFSNSFLATLNGRGTFRRILIDQQGYSMEPLSSRRTNKTSTHILSEKMSTNRISTASSWKSAPALGIPVLEGRNEGTIEPHYNQPLNRIKRRPKILRRRSADV